MTKIEIKTIDGERYSVIVQNASHFKIMMEIIDSHYLTIFCNSRQREISINKAIISNFIITEDIDEALYDFTVKDNPTDTYQAIFKVKQNPTIGRDFDE